MAKHTKHKASERLVPPSIADLVNSLVTDPSKIEWVVNQLSAEGPPHKVLQNELLFNYLSALAKAVEKVSGKQLQTARGYSLSWSDKKERIDFPVPLPDSAVEELPERNQVLALFASGPEHETMMYAIAIQVLNWAANTLNDSKL